MFGVVIPYYQRTCGVLGRTLRSVAQQDVGVPVSVVIVDDDSPVSADEELAGVEVPSNFSIRVIKQKNAGPGAARNRGIDALGDAEYIAFLDSDDWWEPYHLSSAQHAFEHGFDFYTAEIAEGDSGFQVHADLFKGKLPLRDDPSAPWAQELTEPLINYSVAGPVAGLSSLVVTNRLIGHTRFCAELRTAGEDGLFSTSLAAKSPKVMISKRVDVLRGKGVNIFTDGDWGSRKCTLRSFYFLRSRLMMKPLAYTFPVAREKVEATIMTARCEVWRSSIANIRRGGFPLREFFELLRLDPPLLLAGPRAMRWAIFRR